MQNLAVFIFAFAVLAATASAAPTQLEAEIEALLAKAENTDQLADVNRYLLSDEEMAEAEQNSLRELFGSILNGASNYAQGRLNRGGGGGGSNSGSFKGLLGEVLKGVNNYAQSKLQPRIQSRPSLDDLTYAPREEDMARIEQNTLRDLGETILDRLGSYVRDKLSNPDSDTAIAVARAMGQSDEAAAKQELSDILLPALKMVLSNMLNNFFSGSPSDP